MHNRFTVDELSAITKGMERAAFECDMYAATLKPHTAAKPIRAEASQYRRVAHKAEIMAAEPGLTADETCLLLNVLQDGYEIALEAWKQDHGRKKDAEAIKRLRSKLRRQLR
jgi:hypothetical protein